MTSEPASRSLPRFGSTVPHYVAGRPNYAPALILAVADHLRLTKQHRLMDLGCGPGWLGIAFAPLVGQVIGIDPEPAMLEAASALGTAAGLDIDWIEGSSGSLGPQLGRFRAVAIGRAFHWMDRAETLRKLDALIDEDGAVMLFNDVRPDVPQNSWYKRYSDVVDRFTNRSVGFAPERLRHEPILLVSPFEQLTRIGVIEQRSVPVDRRPYPGSHRVPGPYCAPPLRLTMSASALKASSAEGASWRPQPRSTDSQLRDCSQPSSISPRQRSTPIQ
ncbi:class I SAM-dependent methyltransferase [Bradyrhizobium sp. HKCCYLS20291]|uniref:class I SAM-dependent methyltransferase n=1 Tax=Bradyrhizobium sp. HKCCYLS20291 TaxID=3420766 RepID=UPI003EB7EB24